MKLLSTSLLFGYTLGKQWQFEIESIVYEALVDPIRLGFWETKAHCDNLGDGWQLPTPTNTAEVRFYNLMNSRISECILERSCETNIATWKHIPWNITAT